MLIVLKIEYRVYRLRHVKIRDAKYLPFDVPYTLLEEIKDGQAISTKYDSKVLNFKKPNILIVFSNTQPIITRVSKDRWKIYDITKDKLCVRNCMYV